MICFKNSFGVCRLFDIFFLIRRLNNCNRFSSKPTKSVRKINDDEFEISPTGGGDGSRPTVKVKPRLVLSRLLSGKVDRKMARESTGGTRTKREG